MITSTVTRPTTIGPTSVQHFKLHVQEAIDIAPILKPKPVAFSMASSQKRGKPKTGEQRAMLPISGRTSKSSNRDSANGLPTLHTISHRLDEAPPQSPVPSEISCTTATTGSASSNGASPGESKLCTILNSNEDLLAMSDPDTVSAKTEMLQGGCLPGDAFPLRISIKHDKPVKSMQGIIITLYRQGRIDTHPAIPLGAFSKSGKQRYEDYYPKSRTGLGGLSLSSAGSSRSFRQDLNQVFVPIIVDPQSLTAIINTSIQAPADLFPSITNVPGAMVSFRYFIEIVIDLRGKLSGQDRLLPHLSMTSTPQHGYGDPKVSRCEGLDGVNYLSTPGFNYLITDQLRRTKGIISTRTEVIVGTRDSTRRRGKQSTDRVQFVEDRSFKGSFNLGREEEPDEIREGRARHRSMLEAQGEEQQSSNSANVYQKALIPLPEPEEDLDEKAQMRRAEQRLLPSAPPQDENARSLTAIVPSAPPAIDEEDFLYRYGLRAPAPAYEGPSGTRVEFASDNAPNDNAIGSLHVIRGTAGPQDDKQELEYQRLLALASSPDYSNADGAVEGHTAQAVVPTAPVLFEDDIFSIHDPRIPESLPTDFVDDRMTSEEHWRSTRPSTPPIDKETRQIAITSSGIEPGLAEGSGEAHLQTSNLTVHQVPSSNDNDNGNESNDRDDLGVHDDNLPLYRR
jgi:hypothetical protein